MSTLDTNVLILRLPVCDKICPQARHILKHLGC